LADPVRNARGAERLECQVVAQSDSLRYYYLGANWRRHVEHVGAKPATDLGGTLIV
jgi:CRISPR-associated protein Cas2